MNIRIIQNGDHFVVKYKRFLFWRYIRHLEHISPEGIGSYVAITRFKTMDAAAKAVRKQYPQLINHDTVKEFLV
jgi:hypothetical protein